LDYNLDAAQKVAESSSENVFAHRCDVSHFDSIQKVLVALDITQLDVLINNAGVAHIGNVESTSSEDFEKLYEVNVKGVFNGMKACIGLMKKVGGVILNVASIASHVGLQDRFAYSMTKGAVISMSMSVARDYLSCGIRCNTISPARIHTPFVDGFLSKNYPGKEAEMFDVLSKSQPIGRMGKPGEVGDLVLYLCSDEASFITGTDFPIDGGFLKLNT